MLLLVKNYQYGRAAAEGDNFSGREFDSQDQPIFSHMNN